MSTNIRTNLSKKNKYWIPNEKRLELVHFCRQYPEWKKSYAKYTSNLSVKVPEYNMIRGNDIVDMTAHKAVIMADISSKIDMIEWAAKMADETISNYILESVAFGYSYDYLKVNKNIPCGKDMFYERQKRFFWYLAHKR